MKFPLFASLCALLLAACSDTPPPTGPDPLWMEYESLIAGNPASAQVYVDLDSTAFIPRREELEFDLDADGEPDIRIRYEYEVTHTRFYEAEYVLKLLRPDGWQALPYFAANEHRLQGVDEYQTVNESLDWDDIAGSYQLGRANWDSKEDWIILISSDNPIFLPLLKRTESGDIFYVLEFEYGNHRAARSEFRLKSVALRKSE